MKYLINLLFFSLLLFAQLSLFAVEKELPTVLVSVAPYKFFVEKIAQDTVTVILMVPAGASSHTYEPTPKQMANASKGDIWFLLGEPFEKKATLALKSHKPSLRLIDMRQEINPIADSCCCHGTHSGMDPHIWLSPKLAMIQATTIAKALSEFYPSHKALYMERLSLFLKELEALDLEIEQILKPMNTKVILVSHPAYAYFCREYHIEQFSIEFEGKDPTSRQLTGILDEAKKYQIHTVFVQPQYSNKGARLIAKEIGAKLVTLDPYSEEYLNAMRNIANAFANS